MTYFIPSYFQKRVLRYALARLDFLDAEQLNLDNLDIAWGKRSVIELRDLGVQLKKIVSLLQLPPQIRLLKASIKLLRITIPADLYASGIVAEIEGIDIELEVDTSSQEDAAITEEKSRKRGLGTAQKRTSKDQPRSLQTKIHDPGGGPLGLAHGNRCEVKSSESGVLLTTDDLANSFLQAEPKEDKAELQAAVAHTQHLDESKIFEGSSATGVGNGLSLPAFLSGFLKGIRDRFCLKIKYAKVDLFLHIELPSESSSTIVASDRSEKITIRLSVEHVEYGNSLGLDTSMGYHSGQSAESKRSCVVTGVESRRWLRQIELSNIQAAVLSDAAIFSNLLPSSVPSSSSETTFAGSPSKRPQPAKRANDSSGEAPPDIDNSADFSRLLSPNRYGRPLPGSQLETSRKPDSSNGMDDVHNLVTTLGRLEPDSKPVMEQENLQREVMFDSSSSDEDNSRSELDSRINPRDPQRHNQMGSQKDSINKYGRSYDARDMNGPSQKAISEEDELSGHDEQLLVPSMSARTSSPNLQHSHSPPAEDLAESRIFSHEEAESMYMSAMSNVDLAGKGVNQIMPGAWDSHIQDKETPTSNPTVSASEYNSKANAEALVQRHDRNAPKMEDWNALPSRSFPSDNTNRAPYAEEINEGHFDEPKSASDMSAIQTTSVKSSDPSEAETEGSLVVLKPFMLVNHITVGIPYTPADPASHPHTFVQPSKTMPTTTSTLFRSENPPASGLERSIEIFDYTAPNSNPAPPSSSNKSGTSVQVGDVKVHTDMGLARLTALIIKQIGKVMPTGESTKQDHSKTITSSQAELITTVGTLEWHFYDRVSGSPLAEDVGCGTYSGIKDAFVGSELLLKATIQGLESSLQNTATSYNSQVSLARFAFGYASENMLSFDSNRKMRESTRDILAPADKDMVLSISRDHGASKIELTTLPVHVHLDLRRLDETFAWLGGFSSILDLGNSMISTVTTLDTVKPSKRHAYKPGRGVHFEPSKHADSDNADPLRKQIIRKITARVGGLTCTLLGSESSIDVEATALKMVSRAEGLGLQVDRIKVSGLYLKNPVNQPAMVAEIFNVRIEYLQEPKEVDLARLLALLSPSRDKYEVDDDILLDTLLRQRRQGGIVRLTAERSENQIFTAGDLPSFSTLGEELKKLATVAKYLPEDDRPGILTLALIRQFHCGAQIDRFFGTIDVTMKNIELAHITLPSLFALGVTDVRICRDQDEELVAAATPPKRPEESQLPMIMARFVGNEMEPTVKLKLYNVRVEYHIAFILAIMKWHGGVQGEEIFSDMASSIATLTEKTRWREKRSSSRHNVSALQQKSADKYTALRLDVTIRDSLVGLNPRKSSSKGIILLADTHFAGTVPKDQEATATLEIRKAALLIIDKYENIKQPQMDLDAASSHATVSQLQILEAMGYVSVSSISAARVLLQVTHEQESSSKSIDVEIKDDLFVLESCADSTQTLQVILNGLAPPSPQSKDLRYRTEVVPIQDMLSSFSGMAFTSTRARVEAEGEEAFLEQDDNESPDHEELQDRDTADSFYDLDSSRQYAGVSDSMMDEESDSVVVDPSTPWFRETSTMSDLDQETQAEAEAPSLEFQEDHFGSTSSVGGTAHRWNTKHNTYGLPNDIATRKSPLRVRVRDVHVIWNLFDGYDWQHTRDTINQAIAEIETKALNQQSKREKRKPQETEDDEESVIGDFLFNSIYIGIPTNRDPRSLARQVSRNLDDIASESESSVTTTISDTPRRLSTSSSARSRRPRLARSKHHKMTFELKGISADIMVFPPSSGETQSSIDIRVQDLEIFDHVPTSTWKKFATYMQDAGERESGTSMIHIEVLNVRPVADLVASEIILKATILPLRLHVDQDALDFMTRFFEFKDSEAKEPTTNSEVAFLQRVEVNSVRLRLDFKPKRVDYVGIRSGHTNEFMNFFILDRADMVLRHVIIYGISGFDRLGKTLNDIWMPDIKRNQLPGVLAGLAPVRSLVNVGGGVRDLVVVPIREYQKDGRIVRSLQKGALAFAKTTTSELVKLGAKVAIGTQTVLQGAEDMLTQSEQPPGEAAGGWEEAELDEDEKKHISLYADQPVGVVQGLRGAYASLERDLLVAKDAIVAMPGEVMESGTAGGAAKAVLKGAPTIILRPALGVSKAVGRTLMGATNSLDSENRRRIEEVSEP
ncbi:MAG: hypothetical protein Q9170_002824 [Blastenia crenularia]